jgi:hypothetical protein
LEEAGLEVGVAGSQVVILDVSVIGTGVGEPVPDMLDRE